MLPGNLASATDVQSGDILFSIEVKDDIGIESVQIQLATVTGYDPEAIPTDVNQINMEDIRIIEGYPLAMTDMGTTSDDFTLYEDTYNSTIATDGLYYVLIKIGDSDAVQHQIEVPFLILISNSQEGNLFGQIPGFSLEWFGVWMSAGIFGSIYWKKRH